VILPPMIGLTGYSTVGKDTLAELLGDRHEYHRIGLGDPLYAILFAMDPLVPATVRAGFLPIPVRELLRRRVTWRAAKDDYIYGPELIKLLQRLATDGMRTYLGEDVWIRTAQRTIEEKGWWRVVISDIRFANEVEWVHQHGGVVVRIKRSGVGPVNDHVADAGQDELKVDYTIVNDTTPKAMLDALEGHLWRPGETA
jgi:hypothetical protein